MSLEYWIAKVRVGSDWGTWYISSIEVSSEDERDSYARGDEVFKHEHDFVGDYVGEWMGLEDDVLWFVQLPFNRGLQISLLNETDILLEIKDDSTLMFQGIWEHEEEEDVFSVLQVK